jgi:plastocyanin
MRDVIALVGAAVLALASPACSRSSAPASPPAAPLEAAASPPASGGSVTGRVTPPRPGAVVILILEPKSPRSFPPQTEKPVMDQVGQTFGPEVLFVRTGQPVEFRNSDDTLHNVHVSNEETREGAFNVAIPTGSAYTYTFERDGFYHVGCDIHPAMAAEIVSTTTPYATFAGSDGAFAIADVPPGPYTLTMYAEGKKSQRDVDVKSSRATDLNLTGTST